ncbi:MAG: chemotaxis protein CheA, partial [Nitrospinae bacterium]|nr:chemotaxis protein CheA [Nitrospinota bacterium]
KGGVSKKEIEENSVLSDYANLGTILLVSPPIHEIETTSGEVKTKILLASPLTEDQMEIHLPDDFKLLRKGDAKLVEPVPEKGDDGEEEPAASQEEESSFEETDYSTVPFCDDMSMVDMEIIEGYNSDIGELMESLDFSLVELENDPENMEHIGVVFRAAHTIKGTSAMFGFSRVVELTHKLENLFDEIRKEKIKANAGIMDLVFASIDKLKACLDEISSLEDTGVDITKEVNDLVRFLDTGTIGGGKSTKPAVKSAPKSPAVLPDEMKVEGFHLSDTDKRLLSDAVAKGQKIYTVGLSLKHDVMKSAFDPMNIYMVIEMIGGLITSHIDISNVPDFDSFDSEKFYLKYQYLVSSTLSEEKIKLIISGMDQVILEKLEEVPFKIPEKTEEPMETQKAVTEKAPVKKQDEAVHKTVEKPNVDVTAPQAVPKAAPAAPPKPKSSGEKKADTERAKSASTIRVDIERLDRLLNLVGEFVIDRTRYSKLGDDLKQELPHSPLTKTLNETNMLFGRHMTDIQDVIMSVRMVPIGNAFNKFPRVVRDLSRSLGKEIDLVLFGEETELDKTLVEEIGDPLVHLVRNSVDHGIEMPDVRESVGKPRKGTLTMSAFQEGNNIVIEIKDDGGGINKDAVYQKAVERGVIGDGEHLSDKEIFALIFEPGFSTAAAVTNVSGRGVGMDVVRRNIEKLKGIIDIDSEIGVGTTITIKLPLTLAIVQTLIVSCYQEYLAIPLSAVIETVRIDPSEIKILQGKEMVNLRDNVLPLIKLGDFYNFPKIPMEDLGIKKRKKNKKRLFVVIVGLAEKRLGIVVDSLKNQQEIVIKSIGKLLENALGISGGTITGDGKVVLIVDIAEVINNADKVESRIVEDSQEIKKTKKGKSVLLYSNSRDVCKKMEGILEEFDLTIIKNKTDALKNVDYQKVDVVISDDVDENKIIDWSEVFKSRNKDQKVPVIHLFDDKIASSKQKKSNKYTVYIPSKDEDKIVRQVEK